MFSIIGALIAIGIVIFFLIIFFIVLKTVVLLIPAFIIAFIVWLLTRNEFYTILAFLIIATITFLKKL